LRCQRTHDRRLGLSTTTIEEQLAEVRHRIEQLHSSGDLPRLQRHLELVDDVERRLAQLKTRLDVAERALAADASRDWSAFAAAVEAELESWDTYLERLQTDVATRAWHARERAEAAIGDVRSHRLAVDDSLAQGVRERVTEARDELEQKADRLAAKLG
jgi:hypothetical protein